MQQETGRHDMGPSCASHCHCLWRDTVKFSYFSRFSHIADISLIVDRPVNRMMGIASCDLELWCWCGSRCVVGVSWAIILPSRCERCLWRNCRCYLPVSVRVITNGKLPQVSRPDDRSEVGEFHRLHHIETTVKRKRDHPSVCRNMISQPEGRSIVGEFHRLHHAEMTVARECDHLSACRNVDVVLGRRSNRAFQATTLGYYKEAFTSRQGLRSEVIIAGKSGRDPHRHRLTRTDRAGADWLTEPALWPT